MALNDRERWIHYFSLLTIFGIIEKIPKEIIMGLGKKIRDERFRKLTDEQIDEILQEMQEEQQAGKIVMDEILSRLLSDDNMRGIVEGRKKRFSQQPFDIFFLGGDEDDFV